MSEPIDITDTMTGAVDQITADSLIGRTITARIVRITRMAGAPKKGDQPLNVYLDGEPLPWRPCLTMRRLLAALWGPDASKWIGQTIRLYRDDSVRFGDAAVGGVRVSHASIDRRLVLSLAATKGKKATYTVEPLPREEQRKPDPATVQRPTLAAVLEAAGLTLADLDAWATAQGKPAASTLPPAKQQQTADWLSADSSRLDAIRAHRDAGQQTPTAEVATVAALIAEVERLEPLVPTAEALSDAHSIGADLAAEPLDRLSAYVAALRAAAGES